MTQERSQTDGQPPSKLAEAARATRRPQPTRLEAGDVAPTLSSLLGVRSPRRTPAQRNATAVLYLKKADPKLGRWIAKCGPCPLEPNTDGTHFDHLVRSIVYQQLSGKAAAADVSISRGLVGRVGGGIGLNAAGVSGITTAGEALASFIPGVASFRAGMRVGAACTGGP